MAVETFQFSPYVVESPAFNPDFSVFLRQHTPYIVEFPTSNPEISVFTTHLNPYVIDGRDTPSTESLRFLSAYVVQSSGDGNPGTKVAQSMVYQITGAVRNQSARLKIPHTTVYEIFTV